jgi:uncharacterized SAM-binding protein YcdF (DUF218 family)
MFVLAKLVGMLTEPLNLFFLVTAVGCGLLFTRHARLGRRLVAGAVGVGLVLALLPVNHWATVMLEDRFPPPARIPDHVDGIIVLGGAIDPVVSAARGQVSLNGAAERLTALVPLARRHPEARLVFSGGSGAVLSQETKEATYAREFYREIGFDADRIIYEAQSRNTHENALFSKQLTDPKPGETWLLITSALHMPRAVGSFRGVGWPVLPYPVDYLTAGRLTRAAALRFSLAEGLGGLAAAVHEWEGLVGYRLAGWSDTLFPSPAR